MFCVVPMSSSFQPLSMSSSDSSSSTQNEWVDGMRRLPEDFSPGQTSVICGRGKKCTLSPGNRRLRSIVHDHLKLYSDALTKADKTTIVNVILAEVRGDNPKEGIFVKEIGGTWWEVEDVVAREKVGCIIRDYLHLQYRSSTKAKLRKRREREEEQHASEQLERMWVNPESSKLSLVARPPAQLRGDLFTMEKATPHFQTPPFWPPSAGPLPNVSNNSSLPGIEGMHKKGETNARRGGELQDYCAMHEQYAKRRRGDEHAFALHNYGREFIPPLPTSDPTHALARVAGNEQSATKSDSSPDSATWSQMPIGASVYQQAVAIVDRSNEGDELPDDLSGIFDD